MREKQERIKVGVAGRQRKSTVWKGEGGRDGSHTLRGRMAVAIKMKKGQ